MITKFIILAQITIEESDIGGVPKPVPNDSTIAIVLEIVFAVLGSIALLVIVLSGLKYTLSRGNPDATTKARNGIIYAGVGLVLAILAFSVVRFVLRGVS